MSYLFPTRPDHLFGRHARVLYKPAVYVSIRAIGKRTPNYRRNGINHVAKLLLGALRVVDLEIDADPLQERSIARSDGLGATEEPAVPSLTISNSKAQLKGATCA